MSKVLKGIKNEITLKVTVHAMDDLGMETPVDIHLTFKKIHDPKKVQEIITAAENGETDDLTVMRDYLIGWHGVEFEDNEPVPFDDEHLEMVMSVREYKDAIVDGFTQVQLGYSNLKAKNL